MDDSWKHFVESICEHTKAEFPHFRDALLNVCDKAQNSDLVAGSTHDVFTLKHTEADYNAFFFLAPLPDGVELGVETRRSDTDKHVVEILRHSYCGQYSLIQHHVEQLLAELRTY